MRACRMAEEQRAEAHAELMAAAQREEDYKQRLRDQVCKLHVQLARLGGSKLKVHLASPPDRPTVSARHGFRLGTSDRPTRRAQRGGANFELFWVGRPDRPTLFHRQRWVGSRFSGVSANFTRPTDPPAPDSPLSGWVGPPARPTLSAAAPGRKVYFQLRTALPESERIGDDS